MDTDIGPDELNAYVDDQLAPPDRARVERWLARDPVAAARVMADLATRSDLRMAFPPAARADDARRVASLRRNRVARLAPPVMVAASLLLAVGVAFGPIGLHQSIASAPPPAFVDDALSAREASELRLSMVSAPEALLLDRTELRAMTCIVLPEMPRDWVLRDVQIFPSGEGPGVEMVFDTPTHGRVSMFSVRNLEGAARGFRPHGDIGVAWARAGGVVYILSGRGGDAALSATLDGLATTLPAMG